MRNVTIFFLDRKCSFRVPSLLILFVENIRGAAILFFIVALLMLSLSLATSVLLEFKSIRQAYIESVMNDFSEKNENIREKIGTLLRGEGVYHNVVGICYTPKGIADFGIGGGAISANQSVSDRLLIEYNVNENILRNIILNKSSILTRLKEINYGLKIMPSIMPTEGHISSGFGNRIHPILGSIEFHRGIDISARTGTPIVAAADGVVVRAGFFDEYGNMVEIEHGGGRYRTLYAHMHRIKAAVGTRVRRGDLIGTVGATGRTTGAHLHYEVIRAGELENPINFLFPDNVIVN